MMKRAWVKGMIVGVGFIGLTLTGCSGDSNGGEGNGNGTDTDVSADLFEPGEISIDTSSDTNSTDASSDVADTRPPEPGEFGWECSSNRDCNSGFCIQTENGRQCTQTCMSECPDGFECREFPGMDVTFVCMPRNLNLCAPCRDTAECNAAGQVGNYCISYGDAGSFCGVACREDYECPNSYVCRNVPVGSGAEAKQCVPEGGEMCSCSTYAKQAQRSTDCYNSNTHGRCGGTRQCTVNGLSVCDAAEAFPESCNGIDDNCNGITDEFPPDYACNITNEAGTCVGRGTCVDGVESCEGRTPRLDNNCDGIDDDCDGETDEDACNDGNPCTQDLCTANPDGSTSCNYVMANDVACDDGNGCTVTDRCMNGACVGSEPRNCDDGNPCTADSCDPVTGECVHTPVAANTPCDKSLCIVGEFCDGAGSCVGGTPKEYVPKSQGGCIEEGDTYHQDCQSYSCVGEGVCVPAHHTRRDYDCAIGSGTCSVGRCGTDGKCISTVAANTSCVYPASLPDCRKSQCTGFSCENVPDSSANGTSCSGGAVGKCEQNTCSNGSCTKSPRTGSCTYEPEDSSIPSIFHFCLPDMPGQCGSGAQNSGKCMPTTNYPGCSCTGCAGICVCCPSFPVLGSFCFQ